MLVSLSGLQLESSYETVKLILIKISKKKNTLNSITFSPLIQKGRNDKCAYHLVGGILVIQKPMVSKVMAWSHPNKQGVCHTVALPH